MPFFDSMFPAVFSLIFITVIGMFAFIIIRGITTWTKNNNSPRITSDARIVTKRARVYGGHGDMSASTSYYATFEFTTGDRLELSVPYNQYGLLAEGDSGVLTFQGTRYLSFERR